MRAATIACAATLASTTLAAPWWGRNKSGGRSGGRGHHGGWGPPTYGHNGHNGHNGGNQEDGQWCLTKAEGQEAADVFQTLIQNYSDEVALEYLTEDFVDWSTSVNGIINAGGNVPKNLTGPTFASRQEFIEGQGSQPEIPFEQLRVWTACDFVAMRWLTTDSAAGQESKAASLPVVGNVIITAVENTEGGEHDFRISEIFSEFNNGQWLVNLGIFEPDPESIDTEAKKRDVRNLRGNMI